MFFIKLEYIFYLSNKYFKILNGLIYNFILLQKQNYFHLIAESWS